MKWREEIDQAIALRSWVALTEAVEEVALPEFRVKDRRIQQPFLVETNT